MNCQIAIVLTGTVLLVAGCGGKESPTAPNPLLSGSARNHIRGFVSDRVGRELRGAVITVVDGPLAGETVVTDGSGRFELTGTATGWVTLRASYDGFEPAMQGLSWRPATSTTVFDTLFWLNSLEPPIALEPGEYDVTVSIDLSKATGHPSIPQAPCAGFPAELASRSYRATISNFTTSGPYNRGVKVEGPTVTGTFSFSIAGRFVGFEIEDFIKDDLPGFRFLGIGGTAPTSQPAVDNGTSITVPFSGEFRYCELKSARGIFNECSQIPAAQIVAYHSCSSDLVTMLFTKR